jgi:hypothetical protein
VGGMGVRKVENTEGKAGRIRVVKGKVVPVL